MRALAIFLSLFYLEQIQALDTIEPFEAGFSDFELYYSGGPSGVHALAGTLGIGVSPLLNPALAPEVQYEGNQVSHAVRFQNVMNVYEGALSLDLVPGAHTDFGRFGLDFGSELSAPLQGWTPYLQAAFAYELEPRSSEFGAAVGAAISIFATGELFLEAGQVWSGGTTVSRGALGLNVQLAGNMELITEIKHQSTWSGLVGLIQTL
ncbi:MAG: hypothetical protein KDD39_13025 [Bdellovibrionales bacterium]|nr:hypothetical protein [Bdellovibrionales bacterium]